VNPSSSIAAKVSLLPPATDVLDIRDLKPDALHAVIKTAALLSDLSKTLALLGPVPFNLSKKRRLLWGWHKPQSGILLDMRVSQDSINIPSLFFVQVALQCTLHAFR
jgi:hypothetical protein